MLNKQWLNPRKAMCLDSSFKLNNTFLCIYCLKLEIKQPNQNDLLLQLPWNDWTKADAPLMLVNYSIIYKDVLTTHVKFVHCSFSFYQLVSMYFFFFFNSFIGILLSYNSDKRKVTRT